MSQSNNEIPALLVALGLTVALVGGGGWWLLNSGLLNGGADETASEAVSETAGAQDERAAPPTRSGASSSVLASVSAPSGEFAYGGSTTWAPLRGEVDPLIELAQPGFDLQYKNASGSSEGIRMLIDGELAFAQSSRPATTEEKLQAQQQGVTLLEIPVALEAVAIATHLDLPLPGLTVAQLKDIYTGRITNWRQVGGPDEPIIPTARGDSGTVQFFEEAVLSGDPFAANTRQLSTTTTALRFVSENLGAIYFASAPEVVGQCTVAPLPVGSSNRDLVPPYQTPYVTPENCPEQRNQLNLDAFQSQTYPLVRLLYVVVRGDSEEAQAAGTAYADLLKTDEGGELLKGVGFVPLP